MNVLHVIPPATQVVSSNGTTLDSSKTTNDSQQKKTSDHWAYAEQGNVNATQLSKAVDHVNSQMKSSTTKVEFEYDAKSQRYWVNVVDKTSGKVISEVPPEAVRKIVDGLTTSGITVDIKG